MREERRPQKREQCRWWETSCLEEGSLMFGFGLLLQWKDLLSYVVMSDYRVIHMFI
jgi:hypothetical protein